jgi:hypothetical protein
MSTPLQAKVRFPRMNRKYFSTATAGLLALPCTIGLDSGQGYTSDLVSLTLVSART